MQIAIHQNMKNFKNFFIFPPPFLVITQLVERPADFVHLCLPRKTDPLVFLFSQPDIGNENALPMIKQRDDKIQMAPRIKSKSGIGNIVNN